MLKDPRADNLFLIRDFVVAIGSGTIRRLSDFRLVLPNWQPTRHYHYWSAIRDLGFARLVDRQIQLSPLGEELVRVAEFGRFSSIGKLNMNEMNVLRIALSNYKPIKRFLSYFIVTGGPFRDYEQLKKYGGPVVIENNHIQEDEGKSKKSMTITTASGQRLSLKPTEARTMRWSLKLWCKQLGIIDEIWLGEDTWYSKSLVNIPPRLFFPIKRDIEDIAPAKFRYMIDSVVQEKLGRQRHVFIPLLMYHFCTTYFVSVQSFHSKLAELYHSDPYHYYLELGSLVGVQDSRIRDYQNYPQVDGYIRNYLLVRK